MENASSNVGLHICRQLSSPSWQHVLVTQGLTDDCYVSSRTKERGYTIPLQLAPSPGELGIGASTSNCDLKPFKEALPECQGDVNTENSFRYVYAVLFSPTYRIRYVDFLMRDFPYVPLPRSSELFHALGGVGGSLMALHLMRSPMLDKLITTYDGPKNPEVGRVGWSKDTVWLDAAATKKGQSITSGSIGFRGVPRSVWNFEIGGYQVCEKWLKGRKGRRLVKDDLANYQRIIVALNETIRLMAEIDEVIERHGGWPGAFQVAKGKGS